MFRLGTHCVKNRVFPYGVGNPLRKLVLLLIAVMMLPVLASLFFVIALVDDKPTVVEVDKPTPQSLKLAKSTLKKINYTLQLPGGAKVISIDQQQLTAIFALVSDVFSNISARQNSSESSLMISASIEVPGNPFGRYINVSSFIPDDYSDSEAGITTIGSISISNRTLVALISKVVLWSAGDEFFELEGDLVKDISMQQGILRLRVNPELDTRLLLAKLKSQGRETLDVVMPQQQFADVQYYYDYLVQSTALAADMKLTVSLFDFVKLALEKASERSLDTGAQRENISALLAVALLAGDSELKRALATLLNIQHVSNTRFRVNLAGRRDLNLHFIYSVVLTILADQGMTLSIGEIKEISDSAAGGSGFSFIDLTADRAGVRFAEYAIANDSDARRLQYHIARQQTEESMFPDISLLQEGLSEAEFRRQYQDTESPAYRLVVAEIDRRINALVVYQQ